MGPISTEDFYLVQTKCQAPEWCGQMQPLRAQYPLSAKRPALPAPSMGDAGRKKVAGAVNNTNSRGLAGKLSALRTTGAEQEGSWV